jgi:hypothetical protein
MLISEELKEYHAQVSAAVDELFKAAVKEQKHPGDVLLALIFASNHSKFGGEQIGYDLAFHAAYEQNKFISEIRRADAFHITKAEFEERLNTKEFIEHYEPAAIHTEMQLYIKFWEADMYQKMLSHLASLSLGKDFDWAFRLPENTHNNHASVVSRCKKNAPLLSQLICDIYSHDVRNSIAHSQYFFTQRYITLLDEVNEVSDASMSFDNWRKIISKTLLLHNQIDMKRQEILQWYAAQRVVEIKVVRKDNSVYYNTIAPFPNFQRWVPTSVLTEAELKRIQSGGN